MIFASPTSDIEQDEPVTTTVPIRDPRERPVQVTHETDPPPVESPAPAGDDAS